MAWANRDGMKVLSRNLLANGDYTGNPRMVAKTVASLVGYDPTTRSASRCITQGRELGYISEDAKIFGIEREHRFVPGIVAHARDSGLDMDVFAGDFRDFHPPRKLDLMIADLMCTPHQWIGEKIVRDIVPMMNERAGIGINVNVQHFMSSSCYERVLEDAHSDLAYWTSIWGKRYQTGGSNPRTFEGEEPFSGFCCYHLHLPAFVGIHTFMRETDFAYRGCLSYRERAPGRGGTQHMLSLRYERGF